MTFTGRTTIYVDGKLLGPAPRLAVCQEGDGPSVVLYYCDETWDVLAISGGGGDTLGEVKERAERAYAGLAGHWNASPYSPQEVSRFLEEQEPLPACSFCQRSALEVEQMIVKEDGGAVICNICIDSLYHAMREESAGRGDKR